MKSSVSRKARALAVAEEMANSVTHGVGLALSLVGLAVLLFFASRGEWVHLIGSAVFGVTLVFMYTSSTLYHSFRVPRLKRLWRLIDHIAIYCLIAGTYTPFVLVFFGDTQGWMLLSLVWGVALFGVVFKIFFLGRFPVFSTLLYIAMGWLVILELDTLLAAVPTGGLWWLAAGGLAYTMGVAFFAWERLPYNHAIWHLFVLAGSACHYVAVVRYALP